MGTHPIFESDFDCLTDMDQNLSNEYDQYGSSREDYHLVSSTLMAATPAFLSKLWQLVNDQQNRQLVRWAPGGRSFLVMDQTKFSKEILPNYFKHQKMNSFIRQLNMYGFKKVPKLTEGTLNATESDQIEFANDHFVRGQPDLIHQIKRKDTKRLVTRVNNGDRMINSSQLSELLQELSDQQKQTNRDFDQLKDENQDLYRQVGTLQKKHDKQQDTVDRLISFMIHFIQQSGGTLPGTKMPMPIGSKRHGEPLMLGGGGNKRINIEEYTDLDNAICSNNQLTAYSGSSQNGNQMLNQSSNQYFDLQLTAEEESSAPVVNKIQRSLSRQQSTLSSIIGMVNGSPSGQSSNNSINDLNFNQF